MATEDTLAKVDLLMAALARRIRSVNEASVRH